MNVKKYFNIERGLREKFDTGQFFKIPWTLDFTKCISKKYWLYSAHTLYQKLISIFRKQTRYHHKKNGMVTYSRVPLRLAISNLSDDVWSICSGINTVHETRGDGSSQPSSPCQRKPVRHTLCNFHHSAKHDPRLSPPAKLGKKPIRTIHLAFGLCGYH